MSGSNRKLFDNLVSRTKIYLVIIFILLVVLSYLKINLIIPSIIIYLMILGYTYFANNKRRSEISEQLQDLTLSVDSAAKSSLINAPFPLLILETDGNIVWRSSKFITEFANIDINNYISDLIIDIKSNIDKDVEKKRKSIVKEIAIGKKRYVVRGEFAKTKKSERKKVAEYMLILYFIDETEKYEASKEKRREQQIVEDEGIGDRKPDPLGNPTEKTLEEIALEMVQRLERDIKDKSALDEERRSGVGDNGER